MLKIVVPEKDTFQVVDDQIDRPVVNQIELALPLAGVLFQFGSVFS